jgi:hypothetical protein
MINTFFADKFEYESENIKKILISVSRLGYTSMRIRYEDIKPKFIKRVVYILLAAHVLCWGVCYAVSAGNGTLTYPNLFLSRAMDSDPSRAFACILFPIMAFLTGLVLGLRSILLAKRLSNKVETWVWNLFNMCSFLIAVGMIAVPAVPYSLNTYIHLTAAYTVFISGFAIMFLSTYLDGALKLKVQTWVRWIRMILNVGAFSGFLGFAVFFNINYFASAVCEIVAAACMFSFVCTLAHESDFFSKQSDDDFICTGIPSLSA